MLNKVKIALLSFFVFSVSVFAQTPNVTVDVNLDMKHTVGGISTFDRNKFVSIHADVTEQEWDGNNQVGDLRDDFLNDYDVYMGRNTGGISWWLNNQITEDQTRTGFADPASILNKGNYVKSEFAKKTNLHSYEQRNDQVMCAQLHPFWPDGQQTNLGWSFSQNDTEQEPFGTATGEYMGRYINDFFGSGGTDGQKRPNLVEVINEPLWHLVDYGNEQPEKVFHFHNAVADQIKKYNDNIEVGGYCVAFPDLEKNNFQQWEERWKLFMDIAGEKMDFWSMHFYDFPSINNGQQKYRKGSQMEGTLDMIEQYSFIKFGVAKPFLVSEFGAQMHDYMNEWSPYRDWLHVKSVNSMMMQFMRRPQVVSKIINFLPVKAEWGYDSSNGKTYNHRLMRKANEPTSYTGDWVYSDMVKTYQLWSDVKGVRVDSKPTYLDILSDTYVDGNKAYIIVNNLDIKNKFNVVINIDGVNENPQTINVKHLHLVGNAPVLDETSLSSLPNSFELGVEGTLIIECVYANDIDVVEASDETKYYATELLKPITANQAISFSINNVNTAVQGEAILRIGIGRDHGKELYPEIIFNGEAIDVVKDYRGDDQKDRDSFFGVLEVEVPYDLIETNNSISVKFSDEGGHVSSVAMQVFDFSRAVDRSDVNTSIPKVESAGVKIYPNPASDFIVVQSGIEQVDTIELIDLSGRKVLSQQILSRNQKVFITTLPQGVYVALVHIGNRKYSRKIIIT